MSLRVRCRSIDHWRDHVMMCETFLSLTSNGFCGISRTSIVHVSYQSPFLFRLLNLTILVSHINFCFTARHLNYKELHKDSKMLSRSAKSSSKDATLRYQILNPAAMVITIFIFPYIMLTKTVYQHCLQATQYQNLTSHNTI